MKLGTCFLYWLIVFALLGCAATLQTSLDSRRHLIFEDSPAITLDYHSRNSRDAALVSSCIKKSLPELELWGGFRYPVKMKIYTSHADLEKAVGLTNLPWLRAWAKFDEIYLQTPVTWNAYRIKTRVCEVVLHELTHVVMYQHVGDAHNWYKKKIPLWFREGMASVTAGQGHWRLTKDELRSYFRSEEFVGDPVLAADKLVKKYPKLVYSASHWAFAWLLDEYGVQRINNLLALVDSGVNFSSAFQKTFGEGLKDFELKCSRRLGGEPTSR